MKARDLSGADIGRDTRQRVVDWATAVYDRVAGAYTTPPTSTFEWFEINMITHKKNGNVRLRTRHMDTEFLPDAEVEIR